MSRDRRHLIAQRLAAAGGHEHEGVAAVDQVIDDLGLRAAKGAVAEHLLQDGGGSRVQRGGGRGRRQLFDHGCDGTGALRRESWPVWGAPRRVRRRERRPQAPGAIIRPSHSYTLLLPPERNMASVNKVIVLGNLG